MKKYLEITFRIFVAIPTLLLLLEVTIFGWHPKTGFMSQFYNPRLMCTTTRSLEKIPNSNYTYDIDLVIKQPIAEVIPLNRHKTHNINFFTFPDTFIDHVEVPPQVSASSVRYSIGEQNLKRSIDFSYRFIDVEEIKFHFKVATQLNLGGDECALNVSFY